MISEKLIQKGLFWTKGVMLVTGCTKVSEGCAHCWSEKAHAIRCNNPAVEGIYSKDLLDGGRFNGKVQFNLRLLEQAAKAPKPQVIAIWNDLYHEGVGDLGIKMAWATMMAAKQHTFLIVTKRIERIALQCNKPGLMPFPDNIWHIVTAENQARADERIPHLLRIPGKRGIIVEPMLGAIDLRKTKAMWYATGCDTYNHTQQGRWNSDIHQVILGGETGTGARPMHPDWARSVRDQCHAAGVPFFFKSWGEFTHNEFGGEWLPDRVGKASAGRLLDGQEHNALAWNGDHH